MITNNVPKPDSLFSEAPVSWNTRYVTPEGFECQLTLRGDTGQEILEKSHGAIVFLLKNGCTPSVKGNNHMSANGNNNTAQNDTNPNGHNTANEYTQDNLRDWCPIHECTMKRWEKDGRIWYSHKINGEWCSGKVKNK